MTDDARQIELRRLRELELRAAAEGPHTPPEVVIEIQDLRAKHGIWNGRAVQAGYRSSLDYEFLMNTVAAALMRLTRLEENIVSDRTERAKRQTALNIWLSLLTILMIVVTVVMMMR